MNSIFIQTEGKLFSLLIMIFLFVFIKKTFDFIHKEHNLIYIYLIAGTFFSVLSGIKSDEYFKTFNFILCGCYYAVAVFYLCKYFFKKENAENKTLENTVFMMISLAMGILSFYSLNIGTGIIIYLMCFVLITIFAVDQYNKIKTDKLTGLYNRYGMDIELKKQLKQYKKNNTDSFYVILCDLDRFKYINDTWGHPEGDRALELVAEVLSYVSKKFNSTAFRIGGDEFAIVTDTSEEDLAFLITNEIKKEFNNIEFREDFDINISIGYALYNGVITINDLLDGADKKLYESKKKIIDL